MKHLLVAAVVLLSSYAHAYDMPTGGVLNQLQWTGDYKSVCESGKYASPDLTGPCDPPPGTYQLVVFADDWSSSTDGAFTISGTPPTAPTMQVTYYQNVCDADRDGFPSPIWGDVHAYSDDCAATCPTGSSVVGVMCNVEMYIDTDSVWTTLPHGTRVDGNQGICSHRFFDDTDIIARYHRQMAWTLSVQVACLSLQ